MRHLVLHPGRLQGVPSDHPLSRWLRRGRRHASAPESPWGCALAAAGLPEAVPLGPLCALGEGLAAGRWWRLDPVALVPNRDHLVMAGNGHLGLDEGEAQGLAAALEEWTLFPGVCQPHPLRWYWSSEEAPPVETVPWAAVVGQDVRPVLPRGEGASWWRARLAEAEMALFDAAPNRERRLQGRPTVDSLWPWGGGELGPPPGSSSPWVAGDGVLAKGLAAWMGVPWYPLSQTPEGAGLVVVDDGLDGFPGQEATELSPTLWEGGEAEVSLWLAGKGCWRAPPRRWWVFWRR